MVTKSKTARVTDHGMKQSLCENFAAAIDIAVERSGKSFRQVALSLGFSDSAILRYCNGERTPNAEAIYILCKTYNISADYVLGLTKDVVR